MTIQATLAMRPVMLPVHPANLVGYVHSLAVLVPAPYSEYFTSRGFLRCSARVQSFLSLRFLFYCRLPGCPLKGQFMVHMNELMNASIKVNMGNSHSDVSHKWIHHNFSLNHASWSLS